jgi:hypothetical protein
VAEGVGSSLFLGTEKRLVEDGVYILNGSWLHTNPAVRCQGRVEMVEGLVRGINYLHKLGYRILSGVGWGPQKVRKGGALLGGYHRGWSEHRLTHELGHGVCTKRKIHPQQEDNSVCP